jgi:hypothetical protein
VKDMTDPDHIMQLRQQVANLHGLLLKARAERDEARREVSKLMGGSAEQHWYANRRGWHCFGESK